MLCVPAAAWYLFFFFFVMIRRPPRSTLDRSSAASDVYKSQVRDAAGEGFHAQDRAGQVMHAGEMLLVDGVDQHLSLIHISEPTRPY